MLASLAGLVLGASPSQAQYAGPSYSGIATDDPLFSIPSSIGAIEYRPARGLEVGDTGLHIGAFLTGDVERERHDTTAIEFDSINVLLRFQPVESFKLFADLEIDGLIETESADWKVESNTELVVERIYAETAVSDRQNYRFGKFQTPIGRWNQVPAEPFVWTASSPAQTETAFDEHQTGAMLFGNFFPDPGTLSYAVYGQVIDPVDPSDDPPPADRSVGSRLQFDVNSGSWSLGSSFLAIEREESWHFLGGLDAVVQHGPLEITSEAVYADGQLREREIFSVYVQGVLEVLPGFYAVGRYENFAPLAAGERTSNLFDVGAAWIPIPSLYLKGSYRFADDTNEDAEIVRGISASLTVLF